MGHVVVTLDVVEIHCPSDAGLRVKIEQVTVQTGVIDDAPQTALEVDVVDDVEADEGAKETPIGFDDAVAEEIAAFR